jgi:aminoglycoside phosphotransferase (APT) family kinase protein
MNRVDFTDRLRRVVPQWVPDAVDVVAVERLSGGASQAIWSFDVLTPQAIIPLIMRCAQQWSAEGQSGSAGMVTEAALMQLAALGGVPVPRVRGVLRPEDGLGEGFAMDRIAGETQGRAILRDPQFAAIRSTLAAECGCIMAHLHALPRDEMPPLRTGWAEGEWREWAARHRANGTDRPVFELALRWLETNTPQPVGEAVLVHGDFRNGNLIVGPEGVRAVLDWELAHLGDPMEDLGWFCVNSWRFGHIDQAAGGFGSREAMFTGYEAAGGAPVDPARVHFWEVFGTFKWGVVCDSMAHAFASGVDRSLQRAAIGRRASEAEIDLLHLLAPRG